MRNIERRLSRLQDRLGVGPNTVRYVVAFTNRDFGAAQDNYMKILDEGGFLPAAGVVIVDLNLIPRGLNAKEMERFVRENGARICGSSRAQTPSETGMKPDRSIQRPQQARPSGCGSAAEGVEAVDGGIRFKLDIS